MTVDGLTKGYVNGPHAHGVGKRWKWGRLRPEAFGETATKADAVQRVVGLTKEVP